MAAEPARNIDWGAPVISNLIDCSFRPELPPGQVFREQLINVRFYFASDRIRLHLTEGQKEWSGPFGGEIEKRIKQSLNRPNRWWPGDINVRNFLWANQRCLIPESFALYHSIVFPGTLIGVNECSAWPALRRRYGEEGELTWEKDIVFLYNRFFDSDRFLLIALT